MNPNQSDPNRNSQRIKFALQIFERKPWLRYVAALAIVVMAATVRRSFLSVLGTRAPYMTFYPAVMGIALLCGFPAGVLATFLSSLIAKYFWIKPLHQLTLQEPADKLGLIVFIISCSMVAGLSAVLRRTRIRAIETEMQIELLHERKQAEEALREMEGKYRRVFQVESDAMFLLDWESNHIIDANTAAQQLYGYTLEELLTLGSHDLSAEPEKTRHFIENRLAHASYRIHRKKDGTEFPVEITGGYFEYFGRMIHVAAIRDISERIRVENTQKENEARLSLALTSANKGVWQIDLIEGKRHYDDQVCHLLGLDTAMFSGTEEEFFAILHPDYHESVRRSLEKTIQDDEPIKVEYWVIWPDGSEHCIFSSGRVIKDNAGNPLRIIGIASDITEKKLAENRILELNEKYRLLCHYQEDLLERERASISRSIHDEIGQGLTACKLDLGWIKHKMPQLQSNPELIVLIQEMQEHLDNMISKVQNITAELRPPLLDNLGLKAAMEWQLHEFKRRSGMEFNLVIDHDYAALNGEYTNVIMRNLQESLTNIIRHSEASAVIVSLGTVGDKIILEVSDNGRGVTEKELASSDAFGIMGMQERAQACNGRLIVGGVPEGGTTVILELPYL